ncbi:hypothetical protein Tco_0884657 [Tanacetum coccineum]
MAVRIDVYLTPYSTSNLREQEGKYAGAYTAGHRERKKHYEDLSVVILYTYYYNGSCAPKSTSAKSLSSDRDCTTGFELPEAKEQNMRWMVLGERGVVHALEAEKPIRHNDHGGRYQFLDSIPLEFSLKDHAMLGVVGLFKGLERVESIAYKLKLPQELSRVHNTFHISNLKKCCSDDPLAIPLEGLHIDDKFHLVEEPVVIMDRDIKRLKSKPYPNC